MIVVKLCSLSLKIYMIIVVKFNHDVKFVLLGADPGKVLVPVQSSQSKHFPAKAVELHCCSEHLWHKVHT